MPSIRLSVPMFFGFNPFVQTPFGSYPQTSSYLDSADNFYQAMFPFDSFYSNMLPASEEIDDNPFSFESFYSNIFPFDSLYSAPQQFSHQAFNPFLLWEFNF